MKMSLSSVTYWNVVDTPMYINEYVMGGWFGGGGGGDLRRSRGKYNQKLHKNLKLPR